MKQKKSKNIFWVFSILAVVFLVLFSFAVGASNVPMMILTFILLVATFGIGFTAKKKYRENDWL
ncbi:YlaF family protein [Staphylococcus aureus]|nr:YlaF family protein [Staphylococcus aureus]